MNLRFVTALWHLKGSLPLPPGRSSDELLDRLGPLFDQSGTTHRRMGGTLTFDKVDPAAQDRMAVFDKGELSVEAGPTGPTLHYHLISRILLMCALASLLFLGFAGLTVAIDRYEHPPGAAKSEKDKKDKDKALPQHWIDKALGAPAPEKPKKGDKKDKAEEDDDRASPTSAYVFAAAFAMLYVVGRIWEHRKIKRLFGSLLIEGGRSNKPTTRASYTG